MRKQARHQNEHYVLRLEDPNVQTGPHPQFVIFAGIVFLVVLVVIFMMQDKVSPPYYARTVISEQDIILSVQDVQGIAYETESSQAPDKPQSEVGSCEAIGLKHCDRCKQIVDKWQCLACESSPSTARGDKELDMSGLLLVSGVCSKCSDLLGLAAVHDAEFPENPVTSIADARQCSKCVSVRSQEWQNRYLCTSFSAEDACKRRGCQDCSHCTSEIVGNQSASSVEGRQYLRPPHAFLCLSCAKGFVLQEGKCILASLLETRKMEADINKVEMETLLETRKMDVGSLG